ncbi:hypothetical protein SAMN04515618_102211 [Collimonas sp. OK307]|nr:hypothetical protein SAMN04515618_102211 [Collimonas sp. OK307]
MKPENLLLSEYRQHGAVFPLPALSELEALRAYRQYLDFCDPGKVVAEGERRVFGHLLHPWIADLVSHPAVLEAVRSLGSCAADTSSLCVAGEWRR